MQRAQGLSFDVTVIGYRDGKNKTPDLISFDGPESEISPAKQTTTNAQTLPGKLLKCNHKLYICVTSEVLRLKGGCIYY